MFTADSKIPVVRLVTVPRPADIPAAAPSAALVRPGRTVLLLALIALISIIAALGLSRLRSAGAPAPWATDAAGIDFEGVIKPSSEMGFAAPAAAVVRNILVKVGERVNEGDALLELDDQQARAELAAAEMELQTTEKLLSLSGQRESGKTLPEIRSQLSEASGQLAIAQRRLEQVPAQEWRTSPMRAQAAQEQALARYQRAKTMRVVGLIAQQEFEGYETVSRIADEELKNARAAESAAKDLALAQEKQARLQTDVVGLEQKQQITEARLRSDLAARRVQAAQHRLEQGSVRATRPGVVVELPVKIGDQVSSGTLLARIADLDSIIVEVQVAGRLVNALRVGQAAQISLPTLPPRQERGVIRTISPLPSGNMNHVVEVLLPNQSGELLSGQPAQVRFVKP